MNGGNDVRESLHDCCNSFLCNTAAETPPPVTFDSRSECHNNHGEHRWAVKNDASTPPTVAKTIQVVTPSDIRSWVGPDVPLTQSSERAGIDDKWFALTGRVVAVKAKMDGYLQIELQDVRLAIKPGVVIVAVPGAGRQFLQGVRVSSGSNRTRLGDL